jgi:multiple sugar transport system substrate-binding protein
MKTTRAAALLTAVSVLALAGCGSSSSSKGSSPTSSTGVAATSAASTSSSAASSAASAATSAASSAPAPASSAAPSATGAAPSATASAAKPQEPSAKTTITVNCEPPKTQSQERKDWEADVSAFEKLHPLITIKSVDTNPCDDPNTFLTKLNSGQMPDVYYVYFTDIANVLKSGQYADITSYESSIPGLSDIQPGVLGVFKSGDKLVGLPRKNYTMGLIYNKDVFSKAGLDPNKPPETWADVQADAKKISALGAPYVGYADYSAGNTGGWHFTAEMYSQGGDMVTADGSAADFDNAKGLAVLNNLKAMRWTDNTMGSKQLLQYQDLLQMMGGGHLGMYIGAPDNLQGINDTYKTGYKNLAMGPMPGGQGTLLGGDGYMFNKKDSADQIKAGLLWLEYENLTSGQGQFNYARSQQEDQPVGLPEPAIWTGATATADAANKAKYSNIPVSNFAEYIAKTPSLKDNIEPPNAQAIYKVMDGAMSEILTNKNADPQSVLDKYSKQVTQVIKNGS